MSEHGQAEQESSAHHRRARRRSLSFPLSFTATFAIAMAGIVAPMRPAGEPPRLRDTSSLGPERPLRLQRMAGNAPAGPPVRMVGDVVPARAGATVTSTTARPPA